jgi:hypothetical protein
MNVKLNLPRLYMPEIAIVVMRYEYGGNEVVSGVTYEA